MDLQHEKIDALFMAIYNEHRQRIGHDAFRCDEFGAMKYYNCNVCISLYRYKDAIDKERAAEHEAQREEKEEKPAFQGATCGICVHWKENENHERVCVESQELIKAKASDRACIHFSPAELTKENTPPRLKDLVCPICKATLAMIRFCGKSKADSIFGYHCQCTEERRDEYFENKEAANEG